MAGGLQEARQREPVERLLVDPAGKERRDVRVVHGPGRQELAEIDDGVGLDILHVAEGPDRLGANRVPRNVGPGEGGQLDGARTGDIGLKIHRGHRRQPTTIRPSRAKGSIESFHAASTRAAPAPDCRPRPGRLGPGRSASRARGRRAPAPCVPVGPGLRSPHRRELDFLPRDRWLATPEQGGRTDAPRSTDPRARADRRADAGGPRVHRTQGVGAAGRQGHPVRREPGGREPRPGDPGRESRYLGVHADLPAAGAGERQG